MTAPFPARYCDGETLRSHAVDVHPLPDGGLRVVGDGVDRVLFLAGAAISPRLGSVPRFLRFADHAVVEIADSPDLAAWLEAARGPRRLDGALHWLESRAAAAAVATLLLVAGAVAAFWQGLPRLARRGAYAVPLTLETRAGETAYRVFAQTWRRSSLDYQQQQRVQRQLDRIAAVHPLHVRPQLVFVSAGTPNAFALPGGFIFVTDELVQLARSDDEIAAVFAHELGHVERRHGRQSVLRNSSALIVVSTLTGDLSTLSTFSGTLPFLLLQYGYAREFEAEADAFAVDLLRAAHIDPAHLASILDRLDRSRPQGGADFSYLSTHPSTPDRLKKIDPAGSWRSLPSAEPLPPTPEAFTAKVETSVDTAKAIRPSSAVDQSPVPVSRPPPEYPAALRQAGITGEALVEFIVDRDGRVRAPRIVRSSHPGFEKAALAAVQSWTFRPGLKHGRPVNVRMQQPLTFDLAPEEPAVTESAPAPAFPSPPPAGGRPSGSKPTSHSTTPAATPTPGR